MGSTIEASCPCGYLSDLLFVGGGMLDFGQKCMASALSRRARKIVLRNFWGRVAEDVVFATDHLSLRALDSEEGWLGRSAPELNKKI